MSQSIRRSLLLIATAVAAMALVACGDSEPSADDFRAEADEICQQQSQRFIEIETELGTPLNIKDDTEFQKRLNVVRQSSLGELEEIEAPDEVAKDWNRYIEIRNELIDLRKEQFQLLEKEDEKALEPVNEKIGGLNDELDAVAKKIGLDMCASVLPKDQQKEAEAIVEEVSLTTDPERVCRELVTPNYLELGFEGSYEKCARFQKANEEKFATEIEFEKTEGVEDTVATVTITDVDGMFAGEESQWTLVREDDEWKVFAIRAGA